MGLHPGLEARLAALAERIAALRRRMSLAKGTEKLAEIGEVEQLERRYHALAENLRALDREGPGFRQNVKAELEKVADDLSATVEDFTMWIDSDFRADRRPTRKP
jgi:predicted nuclease with TOPRIM domain